MAFKSYIKILDERYDTVDELFNEHELNFEKIHDLKTVACWSDNTHPYIAEYFRNILEMRSEPKPGKLEEFALRIRNRELNEFTLYIMSQWQEVFNLKKYSAEDFSEIMREDTENSQNFLKTISENDKERLIFVYQYVGPKPTEFWKEMIAKTKKFKWKI